MAKCAHLITCIKSWTFSFSLAELSLVTMCPWCLLNIMGLLVCNQNCNYNNANKFWTLQPITVTSRIGFLLSWSPVQISFTLNWISLPNFLFCNFLSSQLPLTFPAKSSSKLSYWCQQLSPGLFYWYKNTTFMKHIFSSEK